MPSSGQLTTSYSLTLHSLHVMQPTIGCMSAKLDLCGENGHLARRLRTLNGHPDTHLDSSPGRAYTKEAFVKRSTNAQIIMVDDTEGPRVEPITEEGFNPERLRHYEGLFALGSGLIHLRGSLSEPLASAPQDIEYLRLPTNVTAEKHRKFVSRLGTYLPTVVGHHPLLNTVIVNLPSPLPVLFRVRTDVAPPQRRAAAGALTVESPLLVAHTRRLYPDQAVLERVSRWHFPTGDRPLVVTLAEHRFVSRARPNIIVQRFSLLADQDATLDLGTCVDGNVRTNGFEHLTRKEPLRSNGLFGLAVESDLGCRAVVACVHDGVVVGVDEEAETMRGVGTIEATGGVELVIDKYSFVGELPAQQNGEPAPHQSGEAQGVATADLLSAASAECTTALEEARKAGYSALLQEHRKAWRPLWADARAVVVEAPGESGSHLRRALDFSTYHLLRAHRRGESRFTICPKGHAGEAYFGRYFWDTEIYLFPFFLYTDPDHARDLLRFRIGTLEGARENAAAYGNKGARFAWESSLSGTEQCPNWQYADHEIHVTADIVYAILHYVDATGDDRFLYEEAADLVLEAARFFVSRLDIAADGGAHLLGVMGPDEYSPFGNDNAFTNRLVQLTLRAGARVAEYTGDRETAAEFTSFAESLPIPTDHQAGVILQSSDFMEYPPLDFSSLDPDKSVAAQAPQELLYRRRALKQADVVALLALFPEEYDQKTVARCLDFYEPMTTHDSSLSPTTHALVAARLGRAEEAWRYLARSIDIDIDEERGDAAEGVHIANAGGNWLVAIFGFLGVLPANASATLTIRPCLPAAVASIATPFVWKGTRLRIAVDRDTVLVRHVTGPGLDVYVCGTYLRLDPHRQIKEAYGVSHPRQ